MRYAENWTKVDIDQLNLENILAWCTENLKGKQFIEGNMIKFSVPEEAQKFNLEFKKTNED